MILILIALLSCNFTAKKSTTPSVPGSCTNFSASAGEKILFGNNEDYYKSKTFQWTKPASVGNYGAVYLGYKYYSHQGGINEKGLCFDLNALPKSTLNLHPELPTPPTFDPPYEEYTIWAPVLILRKAATVEEAIRLTSKYQRKNWYAKNGKLNYQVNFADATGDAWL